MAQHVLTQFEEHPDAWTRVPDVLERSSFPQSKVLFPPKGGSTMADSVFAVHRLANSRKAHRDAMENTTRRTEIRQVISSHNERD
jgi:hypothetical protein